MDISLLNILRTVAWDIKPDVARNYAAKLKNALVLHIPNDVEKEKGFFLSKKGCKSKLGNFEDKLYVGNIHRIENHLYWNDEELADDDQIVNVVMIDGPVTRDGGGCSYGSKDWRDQVLYANTIPQVVGHIFFINTPGGESACRNDYELMIADCREKGKATVAYVDGMCASSGVNLACRCDRTIVRNAKDEFGCIGTMAAFWATPDGAVDTVDGSRYVEIVGDTTPEKNDWYRDAAKGDYEKLQEEVSKDAQEFQQTVRDNRPLVTEDMLKGKVFEAQEVIPALVDEIGDYNRAIDCVFQIADGSLPSAHTTVAGGEQPAPEPEPEPEPEPGPEETPDEQPEGNPDDPDGEQKDMAQLNEQQKAAVATSRGATLIVDDGHVKQSVPGFFGPEAKEIAKPQTNNDMTEEEKKAQEAQAQAAQEQTPASEQQNAEGAQAPASNQPANEDAKPAEGQQAGGEQQAEGEQAKPADGEQQPTDGEQQPAIDADELAKAQQALHTAEDMIAERDKSIEEKDALIAQLRQTAADKEKETSDAIASKDAAIADKDAAIAARDKSIEEKDALIAQLKKQVSDLKGEVKELAAEPTPMTQGTAAPKDNGTGEAPKQQKKYITRGMSYEEVRAAKKQEAADKAAAKAAREAQK